MSRLLFLLSLFLVVVSFIFLPKQVFADYCGPDPSNPVVKHQKWNCTEESYFDPSKLKLVWTCSDKQDANISNFYCDKNTCSIFTPERKCNQNTGRCYDAGQTLYCYVLGNPPGSTSAPQPTDAPPAPTDAPVCPVPNAPTNLRPVGVLSGCTSGVTNLTLSWDPVPGVNQYPLYFNDQANPWNGCESGNLGDFCDNTNIRTTYTVPVQPGRAYDFSVSAVSSCGTWAAAGTNATFFVPACPTNTPLPTLTDVPLKNYYYCYIDPTWRDNKNCGTRQFSSQAECEATLGNKIVKGTCWSLWEGNASTGAEGCMDQTDNCPKPLWVPPTNTPLPTSTPAVNMCDPKNYPV